MMLFLAVPSSNCTQSRSTVLHVLFWSTHPQDVPKFPYKDTCTLLGRIESTLRPRFGTCCLHYILRVFILSHKKQAREQRNICKTLLTRKDPRFCSRIHRVKRGALVYASKTVRPAYRFLKLFRTVKGPHITPPRVNIRWERVYFVYFKIQIKRPYLLIRQMKLDQN